MSVHVSQRTLDVGRKGCSGNSSANTSDMVTKQTVLLWNNIYNRLMVCLVGVDCCSVRKGVQAHELHEVRMHGRQDVRTVQL